MVRPVRRARPDAPPRARRWAGPPPLLVLVTVVGFVVAPIVDREPEPAAPPVTAVGVSSVPDVAVPEVAAPDPAPQRVSPQTPVRDRRTTSTVARPALPHQVRVGVASMNLDRSLTAAQAADDARRLVDRPGLDIVGWREADRFGAELRALPGWGTRVFRSGERGSAPLAISWRRAQLALVAAGQRHVDGRPVAIATLRHRDSGRLLVVVDAQRPQPVADLGRPGRRTPGRWVVGTTADVAASARSPRRIADPTRDAVVSSYLVLGTDLVPTYRAEGRRVAVVYVDRDAHRQGRLWFAGRWVVRGFAGDHDALVTRVVLSPPQR